MCTGGSAENWERTKVGKENFVMLMFSREEGLGGRDAYHEVFMRILYTNAA
jgi:hypothetical protein